MFRLRLNRIFLYFIAVFSLLANGCSNRNAVSEVPSVNNTPVPEVIKIGIFEPLTGAYQYAGRLELEGIQLANQLYPEADQIEIQLVVKDNASDKLTSAAVVSDLIQIEGVSALIGSWSSSLSLSASPILQDLKVPAVSPTSTHLDLTIGNEYYFRACFSDSFQANALAEFAYYDLSARTAVIITESGNDYSRGLGRLFGERFVELNDSKAPSILHKIEYAKQENPMESEIEKIISLNPDIVFLPGGYSESAQWVKMTCDLGYKGVFIGGDTWDTNVFATIVGKSENQVYFSSFYTSEIALTQESTVFLENYKEQYGKEPTAIAAMGYDAYLMIRDAIQRCKSSKPEEIKKALKEISNLQGAAGIITMGDFNEPKRGIIMKTLENGRIKSIKKMQ